MWAVDVTFLGLTPDNEGDDVRWRRWLRVFALHTCDYSAPINWDNVQSLNIITRIFIKRPDTWEQRQRFLTMLTHLLTRLFIYDQPQQQPAGWAGWAGWERSTAHCVHLTCQRYFAVVFGVAEHSKMKLPTSAFTLKNLFRHYDTYIPESKTYYLF